jgi:hypothetical protein
MECAVQVGPFDAHPCVTACDRARSNRRILIAAAVRRLEAQEAGIDLQRIPFAR